MHALHHAIPAPPGFRRAAVAVALGLCVFTVRDAAAQGRGAVQLPPQAAPQAEVQFDGTLEVSVEDSNTSARLVHFLQTGNQRLKLEFDGEPSNLPNGANVRARGRLQNDTLRLSSGGSVQALSALPTANTFGEQKVAVILINFTDKTDVPYDWTTAYNVTFDSTSDFYLEASYGQTWLTGNVYGWFTIPTASTSCDYNLFASLADQAVAASGVSLSPYQRRIYAFPKIAACSWWGLGNVGGSLTRAWVNGNYYLKVVSHELGHNFGAYHSKSQPCDLGGCSLVEYGDDHDVMGQTSQGHFNAFQKERLGWLNYGYSPPIQTVSQSGAYILDPYALPGATPKAIKILKGLDGSGRKVWYYVEARTQNGFDQWDGPGVLVHTGAENAGDTSYEIDLAATSSGFDALLDAGQVFTDSAIGLSITTLSSGPGGAQVQVTLPGAPCTTGTPAVTITPGTSNTVAPGATVTYNVSIKNNDGSTCAGTTFTMTAAIPTGWDGSFSTSSVAVAPGDVGTLSYSLSSSSTANGPYGFSVSAIRVNTSGPSGAASGTQLVALAPTSLSLTLTTAKVAANFQITAMVNAGTAPTVGAVVSYTLRGPSGAVVKTLSATTGTSGLATVKWHKGKNDPSGTYQIQAATSSGGLTASAATSMNVD